MCLILLLYGTVFALRRAVLVTMKLFNLSLMGQIYQTDHQIDHQIDQIDDLDPNLPL